MSETLQIALGLAFMAGMFVATRIGVAWKMRRAADRIIAELKARNAGDGDRAVPLTEKERAWIRFGLRDYRVKAIEGLVMAGLIARTAEGRYFLRQGRGRLR